MRRRIRKFLRYFLPVIVLLVAGLFLLNLQLTKRLERYLKKELIVRTAKATDGFYRLSFDKLSVSFFRGELKMEGIRLAPDSAIFRSWMQKDSLPTTYIVASIGLIDFKGVNLTWRLSYKQLHFNSFEIRDPDIKAFNSYYSSRTEKKERQAETKTLYEVISPYIDVLSVKTLNLENASVSYKVVNPFSPIVYALTNVSFHAYDFRLDKNSSESGKLLYCENFDFFTNQPQTLLANDDFTLTTDSILLSTEDSIIYISQLNLQPQDELWKEKRQRPDRYLNAGVNTVAVNGVAFQREEGLNYLTARSFIIKSPDISAYNLSGENQAKKPVPLTDPSPESTDSLVSSLSLYDIISPVLHSVSIQTIGIEQAKLQYSLVVKDSVEVYKLANFDFQANEFLIDSTSEKNQALWYSRSFAFEATGIEGLMTARNHRLDVKRMALNTETGDFSIEKLRLKPLSTRSRNDYLYGTIDTIAIRGLQYDKGISAEVFKIDNPELRYVVASSYRKESEDRRTSSDNHVDVEGILNPFLRYLSVKKINLNNVNVTLNDRSASEPVTYRLKHFNFFATDFLINEQTGKGRSWFFDYGNMGFNFSNFDNDLPGKEYRLAVRKGQFSTFKGILSLQGIRLTPQDNAGSGKSAERFSVSIPSLYVTGLKRLPENPAKNLNLSSLRIDRPELRISGMNGDIVAVSLTDFEIGRIVWDSTRLHLGTIRLQEPTVLITEGRTFELATKPKKTLEAMKVDVYKALGKIAGEISLGKLALSDATVDYTSWTKDDSMKHQRLDTTDLEVEGLLIDTDTRTFKLDDIRFSTRNLAFPLDNGFYTLHVGRVDLTNTDLHVDHVHLVSRYPKMEFAYLQPHHKDWFDVRVGNLSLSGIDLPGYFKDRVLRIQDVQIGDTELQNFKNQQIPVPRHLVPMIYSGLQKAPIKLEIQRVGVNNFSVVYEELARKGTVPGKLFLTEMNGVFTGFTNIVTTPDQYIRLDANGKLMGKGFFTATWMLPVDSLNDRFLLNARMEGFDLTILNELVTPLASAEVRSGWLKELTFDTEASSKGAKINMLFLYKDLQAALMKDKDGELVEKKFLTDLVSRILKHDNNSRRSSVSIIRDPYHSTFNYLWQILRPAIVESVGVSKKKQDAAQGVATFFTKVKDFFRGKKNHPAREVSEAEEGDPVLLNFESINK